MNVEDAAEQAGEARSMEEREARREQGAAALAGRGGHPVLGNRHLLLAVAATLMTVGLASILLAWLGIARSTMVEEQLAYLVSGGLLGLALATIGALTFFSHWLTELIRASRDQTDLLRELRDHEDRRRRDHERLLEALEAQAGDGRAPDGGPGRARSSTPRRPARRAARGS